MRLIGTIGHTSDMVTTANQLTMVGIAQPEILESVVNLWEDQESTVTSLLRRQNMTSSGLYSGLTSDDYQVVGNHEVRWRETGSTMRKFTILVGVAGDTPGAGGAVVTLRLDSDYASVNDVLQTVDPDVELFVHKKTVVGPGVCDYDVQLVTNNTAAFIPPTVIAVGKELAVGMTAFPELSEDAGEKNTYHQWHTEFMTIQRLKFTISGTAKAMKVNVYEHGGAQYWEYQQNIDTLKRWAAYQEYQNLFGRTTVDPLTKKCLLRDGQGREIIKGNGLFPQGDNSLKFDYNVLSFKVLDNIMAQMDMMSAGNGTQTVMLVAGTEFISKFERLMTDTQQNSAQTLVEYTADGKAIDTSFVSYKHAGVRIIVAKSKYFNNMYRPTEFDENGHTIYGQSAYFVSLGNVASGQPNVMLTTLGNGLEDRRLIKKVISGMAGPSPGVGSVAGQKFEFAASAVDGQQVHYLSQSGIIARNPMGIAELRKTRANAR